jgi:ketosteroid isomerase-like protein
MNKILISALILTLTLPLTAMQKSQIEKELMHIHNLQKKAWNEGNIEGFMAHYWKSKKMTYQSGDTRLQGWDALLARYKREYPKEKMGKLDFSDLVIHVLSEDSAYVLGKWKLKAAGWTKQGLFTTILKKMEDGWKIVHDHSSS